MTGLSPDAFRRSPRRCCRELRRSFATPRRSAAISCSARAAPISTTSRAPATSASRARAATRRGGENRLHAVLGWSESCIATHPSDFCVPLVALDAVVEIEGRAGRREVPLESFHRLPGDDARARERARAGRTDRRRAPAGGGGRFRRPCPLPQGPRAHLLRLRGRLGRRRAAHRRRHDRRGAARPRRRRPEAVARPRGRGDAGRRAAPTPPLSAAPPRRRSRRRSPPATTPSRSSSRAGSSCARSTLAAAGTPERAARASGLPLRPRFRRPRPCLRSPSPKRPPMFGTARTSASRSPAATASSRSRARARYAADNHPPGMLYAVLAVSSIARGRVAFLDVAAAKAHPGVVEVMTPANKPPLAQDPDAKIKSLHVPARSPAERPGPLRQPADRRRHRRDARGGDRRRRAAVAALRGRARAGRARCGRELRAAGVGVGNPAAGASRRCRGGPRRGGEARSTRPTRRRRSITTRWSRMRSSPPGTATRCRSTRRARVSPWRRGASPASSAFRRRTSTSAARSSAAASAPKA